MPQEPDIKKGNDFLRKIKNRLFTKDMLIFLFFLVLAAAFWFVHSLDQQRETTLKIPVDFMGIPEDVAVENKLPSHIEIKIRDEGMTLMKYNAKSAVPLALDLDRVYFSKGKILISSDQLKNRISRYVLPTTAVLEIKPDSIVIFYHKLISKTLPIKMKGNVELAPQYIMSDSLQIEPSSVKVFGPKNILDTMKAVYTEELNLKSISDTTFMSVNLQKPPKGVKYAFNEAKLGIFVEMFTEKKLQIPVTVINAPANVNVRIFPSSVEAVYNIGLSNFNKVNDHDIQVVFNYEEAKNIGKRHYNLQIINNSRYISNLHINPESVEFLIDEK